MDGHKEVKKNEILRRAGGGKKKKMNIYINYASYFLIW